MLNSDYLDMLRILSEEKVKFILVGGYALAAHGYPRSTLDIDFWVMASPKNARAVIRALKRFGAPLSGISEEDFVKEGTIFQIGVTPRRIDLITKIAGVTFINAYERAPMVEWEGIPVHVLSLEDLITNKRIVGRPKDMTDVQMLEHILKQQSAAK